MTSFTNKLVVLDHEHDSLRYRYAPCQSNRSAPSVDVAIIIATRWPSNRLHMTKIGHAIIIIIRSLQVLIKALDLFRKPPPFAFLRVHADPGPRTQHLMTILTTNGRGASCQVAPPTLLCNLVMEV